MSEVVEGQVNEPETVEAEQKVDVEALIKRVEALESSKERLLNESKHYKSKFQNLKGEVEKKENEALAQSNDFKGLYERTLNQVEQLKGELIETKKSKLETGLKYEVAKHAKDAEDVDLVLAAVKMKKRDVLGYDSENEAWQGVNDAVEELRKTNPGLFRNEIPGMETGRPQAALPKEKPLEERILEEPDKVLADAVAKMLS